MSFVLEIRLGTALGWVSLLLVLIAGVLLIKIMGWSSGEQKMGGDVFLVAEGWIAILLFDVKAQLAMPGEFGFK